MYKCEILADSINVVGNRLTTFCITYPRFVHSEFLTHRMISKNSASSRAIPIKKMIQNIKDDPVLPVWWGKNQSGMQAKEEVDDKELAEATWRNALYEAIHYAENLDKQGVHKQIVNRILEPWIWITVIASATEWTNFFNLRCHPDAQPELQKIAYMMKDAYDSSKPETLVYGEWHRPLIGFDGDEELVGIDRTKVSVGRCARVSYLTHYGTRDVQADIDLHDKMVVNKPPHLSPTEHQAMALDSSDRYGNFYGFKQYRKFVFPSEVE